MAVPDIEETAEGIKISVLVSNMDISSYKLLSQQPEIIAPGKTAERTAEGRAQYVQQRIFQNVVKCLDDAMKATMKTDEQLDAELENETSLHEEAVARKRAAIECIKAMRPEWPSIDVPVRS